MVDINDEGDDIRVKLAFLRDQVELALRYVDSEEYLDTDLSSFATVAGEISTTFDDIKNKVFQVNRKILKKIQNNQQWLG